MTRTAAKDRPATVQHELLTLKEVSVLAQISPRKLMRLVREKKLPGCVEVLGLDAQSIRFSRSVIMAFFNREEEEGSHRADP